MKIGTIRDIAKELNIDSTGQIEEVEKEIKKFSRLHTNEEWWTL